MQTSTPIEAHDPPKGPSADPISDIGRARFAAGLVASAIAAMILFGRVGIQSMWLLAFAALASIALRRLLYRRFVGRPELSVLLATGIAFAAAVLVWLVFLHPRG
jgi:4-amino-4-deoxy-L-arabinose transferase-like glycosyltransferase